MKKAASGRFFHFYIFIKIALAPALFLPYRLV